LILLFLLLGIFCTSCALKISKPSNFPTNNLVEEALKFYHQGKLAEATQKLETATQIIPKDPPTWSAAILYSLLGLLQEKSGHSTQASVTFNKVQNLLGELKGTSLESDVQAKKLMYFGRQLKGQDQIYLLQKLALLARTSQGKAGEAFFMILISEIHISLNNFQEAYTQATEALNLSKEAGDLNLEMLAILNVSGSLVALGKAQEAVNILQIALGKVNDSPKLKANILAQLGLAHGALGFENLTTKEFQEAVNLAISVGDTELVARFHWKYGIAYLFLNKPNETIRQLTEAIKIFKQLKDKLTVASLEGGVAQSYFRTGAFEDANQHASWAAELFRELGNPIEEAKNLRTAGQSLAELNKVDDALKALGKAIDIFVEEKDSNESRKTYWWTIAFLKRLGRLEDVRRSLLTALDANAKIFADKGAEAEIRFELGQVYSELGLFSEALKQLDKVLGLYKEVSNTTGQIHTLLVMAYIYSNLKDYENWIATVGLAEGLGSNLNSPNIQLLILDMSAHLYMELGNPVEALQRSLEALQISKLISKPIESGQLVLIGHLYYGMGEYAKALDCFERGFKLAKEISDPTCMLQHLLGMAHAFFIREQYEDALRPSREALEIARKSKSKSGEESALALLSLVLTEEKNYEAALQAAKERLELAQISKSSKLIRGAYGDLGYVYLGMGDYAEAVEAYKKAIVQVELLRGEIEYDVHKTGFLAKELFFGVSPYDGIVEAFYNLYFTNAQNRMQFGEEALLFAEKSKARVWMEQLISKRAKLIFGDIPLELLKELDLLNKQALNAEYEYERTSTGYRIPDEEIEKKAGAREIASEKLRSFLEKLQNEYPRFGLLWPGLSADRLSKLAIRDGETLIVYKVGWFRVYAWVIQKTGDRNEIQRFIRLPIKAGEIEKIVMKLLLPFKKLKYEDFDTKTSAELFDKILKPVLDGISVFKHLTIIPDGVLNVVPFELLVTDIGYENNPKKTYFLADKFLLSYYPSAAMLNFNRRLIAQTLPPQGSLFAVGDPICGPEDNRLDQSQISFLLESAKKYESEFTLRGSRFRKGVEDKGYTFDRLRHSGLEVQKIRDIFGNSPGDKEVLVGFDASEGYIKSRDLTKYRYLHFALHGILAFDVPYLMEPALVLAIDPDGKEDGFLTLTEINELKLNADLVTLSACKTGLGQRVAGEGVIGLSRAFINAGARAVLVSLWEVADDSTALFMEEFYRLISLGEEKVGALAEAKQRLRQMGYKNPYFWAPFILIGD
jgi:CHAT domain-containing protein